MNRDAALRNGLLPALMGLLAGGTGCGSRGPAATSQAAGAGGEALAGFVGHVVDAQGVLVPDVPVPQPTGGTIVDQAAAVRLGKAFFWDVQTSSDGKVACASCHFHAGVDNRARNTVNPGPNAVFDAPGVTAAGQVFAFTSFDAALIDDRVGSSGVQSRAFGSISLDPADPVDVCAPVTPTDPAEAAIFGAGAEGGERLITGRNTPSMINAIFNQDSFWDGRAKNGFNGQSPIGAAGGAVLMTNSSLASQAVGPPLSEVEMSCAGRTFNGPNSVGAKLVPRSPLGKQLVDPADGVLGPLSRAPAPGLACGMAGQPCTYADLIAAAFGPGTPDDFVASFSLIWGQAIQAYESTLVANRTPYDRFVGGDPTALTAAQQQGLASFRKPGKCVTCHVEPEFTDASVRLAGVPNPDGADPGFHNLGVSVEGQDLGRAASPAPHGAQPENAGAFKTPSLRNVKLTAPYMHNGRLASLPDVLRFYHNAGSPTNQLDNPHISAVAGNGAAGFGNGPATEIVDFLENGLTDCRVEHELAPFDHPELPVQNGPVIPARGSGGDGTACP